MRHAATCCSVVCQVPPGASGISMGTSPEDCVLPCQQPMQLAAGWAGCLAQGPGQLPVRARSTFGGAELPLQTLLQVALAALNPAPFPLHCLPPATRHERQQCSWAISQSKADGLPRQQQNMTADGTKVAVVEKAPTIHKCTALSFCSSLPIINDQGLCAQNGTGSI